jgi:hypothetical protein
MAKIHFLKKPDNTSSSMTLTRVFCDDCGTGLQYWLSQEEDTAYGLCPACHLGAPVEVSWSEKIQDDQ